MAQPEPDRPKVTELAARRPPRDDRSEHGWLVPHLISLVGYAERHGLTEIEAALAEAAERIAPAVQSEAADKTPASERLFYLRRPYPEKRD
ncbi:hypothetical protein [Cereibacter johrii]|uniref:Uncharacterized protein n=1 Tax=Cereibacter johrii TaxID=445629 RepID=A0ABX5JE12_9RHOB|nr:hypothetical protein [Cereibacter johrii]QCP85254.1 hypothetical protein EYE35_06080 [Cereibacter sphaeroides]RDS94410.1 hypothetical protein DWF04_17945 [Cereibacter sphaeroides f. sp. denitrificans]MEA5160913.1 hypothetical protein [Cereibacter johrii]ODM41591.1 hypothetical protein A9O63_14120 [Cereibacter johrii]PTM80373.1 hypothetical protein C8J29_102450 [Cereibacter johrii]